MTDQNHRHLPAVPDHHVRERTPMPGAERLATPEERPETDRHDELALPDPALDELEQVVVEGEIVDNPDPAEAPARRLPARIAVRIVAVRPPEPAARAAGGLLAAALTTGQGWHSWLIRAWDGLTMGVYRRQIRAAEAAGEVELLAEWVDRRQQAADRRRARLADLPGTAVGLAKVGVGCLAAVVVGVPVVAIVVGLAGAGNPADVIAWVAGLIRWCFAALSVAWKVAVLSLPLVLVAAGWREGRRRGSGPTWEVGDDADPDVREVIPDEGAILNALRNLGIAKLDKAFKGGWQPRFTLPTERDGNGYHTQLQLPPAVTVEMINDKKKVLAHNLVRFPVEVWPTEPRNMPGVLDMWVADQGSLTGPVPPWPLLKDGTADYFRGVPVAVNIRGKRIIGRLFEANYAIAGIMGSGKSTLIINLLLGALLDPLVDADVFVLADNADYDPMKPRLRTLMTGAGGDVIEACMDTMSEFYNELATRGKALREHGVRAASRNLAEIDARLRPRIMVIDECQALYLDEEYGERAIEMSVKLQNAARKYAITIIRATPEASSDSLPRRLTAVTSNKACFAIGDQTSNDAVLGTGAYKAGISAVGLEPKTDESLGDVGTFMGKGFEPKPGLLRSYFVSQAEAGPVVQRALQIREKAGIGAAGTAVAERDLLDDLDEVLGAERVRLADVPPMLRRLAPIWRPYETLTGIELRDVLTREYEVRVTNSGNVLRLDPDEVRRARALRDAGGE